MAEEEEATAEPDAAEGKGASKGKSKILIIIIVLLVALGAGGGAVVYFVVLPKMAGGEKTGDAEKQSAKKEVEADVASLGATAELPSFIVNLGGGSGRYLKVTVVLKLSAEDVATEIKNREPQIKDAVITVLSSKTPEEILSVQGKYELKGEIMKRINVFLATGVVKELFFVEFVVQ
ncbi:hypothetical protein MNBD_NITROSPINAE04-1280 [hydrothermal vent metagenome]|uniref:Flagellar protein FliL n=1 Tax=hydrothermal vent metagenome TaxID=652676 RepID=A0A3B1D0R4_9ZZZZ